MANDRIKVAGYAKKEVFNGNIEYRNFADDLVGFQLANSENNTLFTLGNFAITTNLASKPSKIFTTNRFSNFITLNDLDLSVEEAKVLLNDNSEVKLKLDKSDLTNYAYFGSLLEFVRVSLEDVITKWPASLYVNPVIGIFSNNPTLEDYNYNIVTDKSSFKINTNVIRNPYELNYLQNGTIVDTFNEGNDLRNFTVNFESYVIFVNDTEYKLLDLTAATKTSDDYIYLQVQGNPFSNLSGTSGTTKYHIKPNKLKEEDFFNKLSDFGSNLLNRLTKPKYSSTYKFPQRTESGSLVFKTKTITWPVSDGYNIDFDTSEYTTFVSELINIATYFDKNRTNLMVRFLTSESISDFDTIPRCDGSEEETAGQKMNRTLKIYGREYDEIKRYIDGIQYANTVTYNQINNTPDAILKYLARTLGWDLIQSILENDLLQNYITSSDSSYSGNSRGLTAIEAEIEMWRRLILNSAWIWKSKGTRKAVEFLFKFIGAPDGLIEFNEFIYVVKNKLDVDLFKLVLEKQGLDTDLTKYPMDSDGYPRIPNNNSDMYFQKGGLWYRQTAGSASTIDILEGNNPHVGPYDGGSAFINQFKSLIPNFSAVTITSSTVTTGSTNLFSNYNSGTINDYNGEYWVDIISDDDVSLDDCYVVTTTKITDPHPSPSELTDCGCEVEEDDFALMIDINKEINNINCSDLISGDIVIDNDGKMIFNYKQYDQNGNLLDTTHSSNYSSQECCGFHGGSSIYYEDWDHDIMVNAGYFCCSTMDCGCTVTCNWDLLSRDTSTLIYVEGYSQGFLQFQKPNGDKTIVTPTGCSCIAGYTTPINVTDPITGESGVGCMVTESGHVDLESTTYYTLQQDRGGDYFLQEEEPIINEDGTTSPPSDEAFSNFTTAVYDNREELGCDRHMNTTGESIINN